MNTANTIDAARLNLLLTELRLPAIKVLWPQFAEQSDKEGWPAPRFLATIAEHEIAERGRRRIERHLVEARLPAGKTLDNFDFEAVPMISKAQVTALAAGDGWLGKGANCSYSGRPAAARATWQQRSAWPSSRTDGASCSPAPPISCKSSRWRGVSSTSRRPSVVSIASIS